jgi:two-component system, OmpR family, sensor kinase
VSWHRHRHRHDHDHGHGGHRHHPGCGHPFYDHLPAEGAPFPWDRVMAEARARRPGWRRRIRQELHLHYGAHLHHRLFRWFGAAIFLSVGTTILASHLGRAWLAAHPWRAVLLFGIPAVCLWIAAGRIARLISKPIYSLTRAAKEIGQGNLAARASLGRGAIGEIGVLSSAFNDMASRLERQLTEQRELLAAVSHELRTPLARIRLLVEIARQSGGTAASGTPTNSAPASIAPATLDDIEREAIEIDTLVGELLASARLEFQAVTRKPLEAGEAARRALERAGEDAAKLAAPPGPLPFVADPTLMARALANLIDNARKHGGGLDGIAVRAGDGTVVFEVSDRGPGFAPGDETRVFDRFYRGGADARGAADAGHHGSLGLGLALVQRIAVAHGGRAGAGNRPEGGARVTLELPVAPVA